jgi:hypothetical protein
MASHCDRPAATVEVYFTRSRPGQRPIEAFYRLFLRGPDQWDDAQRRYTAEDTRYMTDEAFLKATGTEDKELFLLDGAQHIETY